MPQGTRRKTVSASDLVVGTLALAQGGTGADLSGTGGANQYLTQATAGAAVTLGTLPGATFGGVTMADGTYDVTGSFTQPTGVSLSLPAAGTYVVAYNCRWVEDAVGALVAELYNSTDAAVVAGTEILVEVGADGNQGTSSAFAVVTVAAPKTIQLQVKKLSGTFRIASDANGRTGMVYFKLAA